MNKKRLIKYGIILLASLAMLCAAVYLYAFFTLKGQAEKQGEISGFKLFLDGIVIDEFKLNPSVKLSQVYMHGNLFELLQAKPEYISIAQSEINADAVFEKPIAWPFNTQSIDVQNIKISKTILQKQILFTGSAKQTAETPLLLDFSNNDENHAISGKAEIRIDNHQIQMIDIDLSEADIDLPPVGIKRGSGWLSFSYEDDWQVVGELDAGITLLGTYQFFDSTVKLTGAVNQSEMTFSGKMDQTDIVIDQREGHYFLRQEDKTLPIADSTTPLQEIILTLDKVKLIQLAAEESNKQKAEKTVSNNKKKPEKQKDQAIVTTETKPEAPPIVPVVVPKIEPIALPQTTLSAVTANTSLAGFIYEPSMVLVNQPCGPNISGQCWTAHGQGGQFTYDPAKLPTYFMQLKDYEQLKQLRGALFNFAVKTITVQGKDKTAQTVILKGTTIQNQPAEIQLAVTGLE